VLFEVKKTQWLYPRGHMDAGETEEQTAVREVKEETGVDIEIVPGFREQFEYWFTKDKQKILKEAVVLVARATSTQLKPQLTEIDKVAWVPVKDAVDKISFETTKDVLRKAIAFAKKQGIIHG